MISLSIATRHTSRLTALLAALLLAGGPTGARPAPPRTVLDYYLLLPFGYFGGLGTDSRAERLRLVQHRKGSFVDIRNGYLHVAGDGAQTDLDLCIFRRPDRSYLLAVAINESSDGMWEPSLDFFVYRGGHLVDVTRRTLPRRFSPRLGYRLPRYGRTIEVIDRAGRRVYGLVWNGRRFRVRRVGPG